MQIHTINVGVDNCYLIRDKGSILIDGGSPGAFADFSAALESLNVPPEEISAIVLTHCHWDHIGCASAIKDATHAKVLVHENEKNILQAGQRAMPPGVTRWGRILAPCLTRWSQRFQITPCDADILIGDEGRSLSEFGIAGKIVFTPGHSSGSVSVVLASGDAFVGDMAMNGLPLTIRPKLPIFAEDLPTLRKSWDKLMAMGIKTVYPAHGSPFPIEKLLNR